MTSKAWQSVAYCPGREVETNSPLSSTLGGEVLSAGSKGKVVWDEGGAEVIVDFGKPLPNFGGYHLPTGQAWIPKSFLTVIGDVK
ncbi:hypothetical protein AA14337_2910 [Acetobacter malorum DSM 14337]|uniref:Uncharacterized protein n=1 Tax=Acetobacter malorum DSM 14337 TaxID=1307910 RepID=A0ABQ0PYG4_9PROT|nr:hypothetical protein AA14337_2910 [Acetobacter malorum DSM 14337]